jgi:hypothetical protein
MLTFFLLFNGGCIFHIRKAGIEGIEDAPEKAEKTSVFRKAANLNGD